MVCNVCSGVSRASSSSGYGLGGSLPNAAEKCPTGQTQTRPVQEGALQYNDRTTFPTTANVNVAAPAPLLGDKLRFEYANPMFCCQDVCSFGAKKRSNQK